MIKIKTPDLRKTIAVLLLAAIPVIIFFAGLTLRNANQEYSFFAIDPEYSYLYSGILLGQGNINLFIDHPGTPLIVLAAIVLRTVHLFRPSHPFAEDVLLHPDFYLGVLNISLITLIALVAFFIGFWIYRKTGNLPAAVFLQLSPFVVEYVFSSIERYMPEPFLIAVIVVLCGFMMLDIHGSFNSSRLLKSKSVMYGLIIGFGISLKFTFAAFLIAPLFLLQGFRRKFYYIIATVFAFLIFTFPLIKRSRYFYDWIKAIFLHTGKYGSGEATIINVNQFLYNLKSILNSEKHLLYALLLAIIVLILSLIPYIRKRIGNKKYLMALAGTALAMFAGILAISKHYEAYYLIPYSMLTVFIVYLTINVILEMFRFRKMWIEAVIYAGIAILMLTNPRSIHQHNLNLEARRVVYQNKRAVINQMQALPPADALLLISDNWHVKKESGLIFGLFMTPSGRVYFGNTLTKHYPHTYLFKESDGNFYDWFDAPHTPTELLERYETMEGVVKHYNPAVYEQFVSVFQNTGIAEIDLIFQDPVTGVHVYHAGKKEIITDF